MLLLPTARADLSLVVSWAPCLLRSASTCQVRDGRCHKLDQRNPTNDRYTKYTSDNFANDYVFCYSVKPSQVWDGQYNQEATSLHASSFCAKPRPSSGDREVPDGNSHTHEWVQVVVESNQGGLFYNCGSSLLLGYLNSGTGKQFIFRLRKTFLGFLCGRTHITMLPCMMAENLWAF